MACIKNTTGYNGPGIYLLRGTNNPFVYVGRSKHVDERICQHNSRLHSGKFHSKVANKINDGDEFEAILLEKVSPERSEYYFRNRENYYINKFGALGDNGLNTAHTEASLREDIERLQFWVKDFEDRVANNSADNSRSGAYTERLVGCTERDLRGILRHIASNLDSIKD